MSNVMKCQMSNLNDPPRTESLFFVEHWVAWPQAGATYNHNEDRFFYTNDQLNTAL